MVILYNPRSSVQPKPILPNSLLALAALLEGQYSYDLVDGNLETDPLRALDRAVSRTRDPVLAVSVMPGPQLEQAVPHCRELKRRYPELTVVWGGYFPTQHYEACLRAPYVDYVVRGHGEVVFLELLNSLRRGHDPSTIAGVACRDRLGGQLVSSGLAPLPHPQEMPEIPYHRIDGEAYARKTCLGFRTFSYHSSYGCPFRCNFCAVVNLVEGKWLPQSADRTARVVESFVSRWGADAVEFHDNNFFVSERRTARFCELIRPLGIGWWGEARIDTLLNYSDRSWDLMRDSGLRMVFLGAESGSDHILQRMDKGGQASVEKTLLIAKKMDQYGIVPEFSFVVGNPPDPLQDAEETMLFIRKLKKVNPRSEIILYIYTPVPLPGSLYEEAAAKGFRFPETLEEWVSTQWLLFSKRRSSQLPWLPARLSARLRDFERVLNAFFPTSTDPGLSGGRRLLLRGLSCWRYWLRVYRFPVELRLLQRWFRYQRPETSGF